MADKKAKAKAKPYKPSDRVLARHKETGEQYGVSGAAFDKGFAARGFEAVSFEDGRAFDAPEPEEAPLEAAPPTEEALAERDEQQAPSVAAEPYPEANE
jgi:hypothetical protein